MKNGHDIGLGLDTDLDPVGGNPEVHIAKDHALDQNAPLQKLTVPEDQEPHQEVQSEGLAAVVDKSLQ